MAPPIAYIPGHQAPNVSLSLTQTGALTYMASAAVSSGAAAGATIDFGDGTVASGTSASHTYGLVGRYLVIATAYDSAGASAVAVQQISVKPSSGGITIFSPSDGSTVNWPTVLTASANPGTTVSVMRVLIDGQQAYAANGDTLNTALKVLTGTHQISVQSLDNAGDVTASALVHVVAEPNDIPPLVDLTLSPLPNISPTTVLGCTAASTDADGFLISHQLLYSDGSQYSTPAAVETFSAAGAYTATGSVTDQFGATSSKATTFTVNDGQITVVRAVTIPDVSQATQKMPLHPMRRP